MWFFGKKRKLRKLEGWLNKILSDQTDHALPSTVSDAIDDLNDLIEEALKLVPKDHDLVLRINSAISKLNAKFLSKASISLSSMEHTYRSRWENSSGGSDPAQTAAPPTRGPFGR